MTSRRLLLWCGGILAGASACAVADEMPELGLGEADGAVPGPSGMGDSGPGSFPGGGAPGVGAGGSGVSGAFPGGGAPPFGAGGGSPPPPPPPPPPGCGNGAVEMPEECDGMNLNGQSCASATMNALPTGFLACTPSCTIDLSGCTGGSGGAGTIGAGGSTGTGVVPGGTGGTTTGGTCCPDGNCLCHGPDPSALTSAAGPFATATLTASTGTIHYPTNAEPPFAGVAICPGFLNTGPEMAPWGTFYASHGIVTLVTNTLGSDVPDIRATKLLAAVDTLKAENTRGGSPLFGKMSDRYGTSGYSMGGGGTTIASTRNPALRTSIGLAAWGPATTGVQVPTLLLCGSSDTTAPCSMSQGAYNGITGSTPKMMISIVGATHFNWFGPTNAGGGTSGKYALAFQKVFLEGDERWRPLLVQSPTNGTMTTGIR